MAALPKGYPPLARMYFMRGSMPSTFDNQATALVRAVVLGSAILVACTEQAELTGPTQSPVGKTLPYGSPLSNSSRRAARHNP
jgi:hypothetical protein